MTGQPGPSLIELLHSTDPDFTRIIDTFITRFNAAYGSSGMDSWDISREDWQRYEFLGDRVLEMIIAQALFTDRNVVYNEGEMTRILSGLLSNRALDSLARRYGEKTIARLIPASIGEQQTYGERITAGAFEAFVGALYCEVGLDDVVFFITTIMGESLFRPGPDENAIGNLQEYFQKFYKCVPCYRQTGRTGPDHKPVFTYQVLFGESVLGEGSGESIQQAQQAAARRALKTLPLKRNP
jgi:ribonuclease-3